MILSFGSGLASAFAFLPGGTHPNVHLFLGQQENRHRLLMNWPNDFVGIGREEGINVVGRQPVLHLADALPLGNMDSRKEHERLAFITSEPGVWRASAILFAGWIGLGETGHRHDATALDTEPFLPMRDVKIADVGDALVRFHPDEHVHIDGLALLPQLLRRASAACLITKNGDGSPHRACTSCLRPSAVLRTIGPA